MSGIIAEAEAERIKRLWNNSLADDLAPFVAVIPDRRWLPRRMKKTWRKFMDGRFLTSYEWECIHRITKRRSRRVKYLRVPIQIPINDGRLLLPPVKGGDVPKLAQQYFNLDNLERCIADLAETLERGLGRPELPK